MSLWGEPKPGGSKWSQPKPKGTKGAPKKSREDSKVPHLVKTDFWGRKIYCDPKTGKPLKNQNVHDEGRPKIGWF
jgi:hypothetical protein